MSTADSRARLDERVAEWDVAVERITETNSSLLAFGLQAGRPVVVKVIRAPGDEWRSGEILDTFEGKGVVAVFERTEGALLLERLAPGSSLATHALSGADAHATRVLAKTIRAMSPRPPAPWVPTVAGWGNGFERYVTSGDSQIPGDLVRHAQRTYFELCDSQSAVRLLHGDFHHYNVLFDGSRGWLAVDPKGVIGELEYELGAALRNPYERPALFAERSTVERRVERLAGDLGLSAPRVLAWAFAQAVLAAIWAVEDGETLQPDNGWIALAETVQPMVTHR
jgi:streptomycin 6-kinase